ncbi:MAG: hypothetical protein MRZ48_05770 [Anaerostipes hadrus]|nr:hypothetical protein [Anaerostipes hadrus]
MEVTSDKIEAYLLQVKDAIFKGNYSIARNSNRQDNNDLFNDYVIDEEKTKEILLTIEVEDFSEVRYNEHKGYEHELLYIFGKEVRLLERWGSEEMIVPLYIKFNKLENQFVIVISFHRQKYPMKYYFK